MLALLLPLYWINNTTFQDKCNKSLIILILMPAIVTYISLPGPNNMVDTRNYIYDEDGLSEIYHNIYNEMYMNFII